MSNRRALNWEVSRIKTRRRINENQETISFGIGNLVCRLLWYACFRFFDQIILECQLRCSKASNIFTGILILIGYFYLGDFVCFIPVCSLAMLVVFIGLSLVKWSHITTAIRTSKSDAATFLVTFSIGIIFSLQMAIFLGVITSLILFLKKVAEPEMVEHGYNENGELAQISTNKNKKVTEVSIVHVEENYFLQQQTYFMNKCVGSEKKVILKF